MSTDYITCAMYMYIVYMCPAGQWLYSCQKSYVELWLEVRTAVHAEMLQLFMFCVIFLVSQSISDSTPDVIDIRSSTGAVCTLYLCIIHCIHMVHVHGTCTCTVMYIDF